MKKLSTLLWDPYKVSRFTEHLEELIDLNAWVQLAPNLKETIDIPSHFLPDKSGLIIRSGGSSGGANYCFQPFKHFDQSAIATGLWLRKLGLQPSQCLLMNSLPMHHVSGLMPWWRSKVWGSKYRWLNRDLMRNPITLNKTCQLFFSKTQAPLLTSLVPTQIQRLISHPDGLQWMQSFSLIWVGGSSLSKSLANKARSANIRLAPCYGATETASMVSVLTPEEFLAGKNDCGNPLIDVELRVDRQGALNVKTQRLAIGRWKNGQLEVIKDKSGWWESGDAANLTLLKELPRLQINGRIDTAITCGGETIFPETLEGRLLEAARSTDIPIRDLLFSTIEDNEWGERIIALISWNAEQKEEINQAQINKLRSLTKDWLPAEKPVGWINCKELRRNYNGKWERLYWREWVVKHHKNKAMP